MEIVSSTFAMSGGSHNLPAGSAFVARRGQFLTVRQGPTRQNEASARGPLRARRAIRRPRRQVQIPLLAAQVSADDRAGAPTPYRRVDVPQRRARWDSRDRKQLAIRAERVPQSDERKFEGRLERGRHRGSDEPVAVAQTRGRFPQPGPAEEARRREERAGRVERRPRDLTGVPREGRIGRTLIRHTPYPHGPGRSAGGDEAAARIERDPRETVV